MHALAVCMFAVMVRHSRPQKLFMLIYKPWKIHKGKGMNVLHSAVVSDNALRISVAKKRMPVVNLKLQT